MIRALPGGDGRPGRLVCAGVVLARGAAQGQNRPMPARSFPPRQVRLRVLCVLRGEMNYVNLGYTHVMLRSGLGGRSPLDRLDAIAT